MALNEEPNRPDPVLRAFTEMIEATFVKRPTPAEVHAADTQGDLIEALRELDEQITELIGLLYELRRVGRPDDYKPFA